MQGIYCASNEYARQNNLKPTITKEHFNKLAVISRHTQEHGKEPIVVLDSQESAFKLVMDSAGVGFFLNYFLELAFPNSPVFKFIVEDSEMQKRRFTFYCLQNKNLSRAAKEFLSFVRKVSCGMKSV